MTSTAPNYEEFLQSVDTRSWSKCDTLSGELCTAVTTRDNTSVLVFEDSRTNKPHIRTVVLDRADADSKWRVRTENIVNLPPVLPTEHVHVCTTSNTPDAVPSVTPSITLTGHQIDRLRAKLRASVSAVDAATINQANDEVVAALIRMIGTGS